MIENRIQLINRVREIVRKLAPVYRMWHAATTYDRDATGHPKPFKKKEEAEIVEQAKVLNIHVLDPENEELAFPWTHGDCDWIAFCLKAVLDPVCKVTIVEAHTDEGPYHRFCRVNIDDTFYYFDGVSVSEDYTKIYGKHEGRPLAIDMGHCKKHLAYGDVNGAVLFSTWCEIHNIAPEEFMEGWEHPLVLFGSHDLHDLYKLLNVRVEILKHYGPGLADEVLTAYKAGK